MRVGLRMRDDNAIHEQVHRAQHIAIVAVVAATTDATIRTATDTHHSVNSKASVALSGFLSVGATNGFTILSVVTSAASTILSVGVALVAAALATGTRRIYSRAVGIAIGIAIGLLGCSESAPSWTGPGRVRVDGRRGPSHRA
uniref:Uncharacterized protein n=1 Tax=Calcidiscus leptoporus TaxID=127549 RepID=A0A7S0P0C1_9EUKA